MTQHISPFDAIRQVDEQTGNEYWSARDLSKTLEYALWQKFRNVIAKAQEACKNSGQAVADHFIHVDKMIRAGKGARRPIDDYHLSRYACYLIVRAPV